MEAAESPAEGFGVDRAGPLARGLGGGGDLRSAFGEALVGERVLVRGLGVFRLGCAFGGSLVPALTTRAAFVVGGGWPLRGVPAVGGHGLIVGPGFPARRLGSRRLHRDQEFHRGLGRVLALLVGVLALLLGPGGCRPAVLRRLPYGVLRQGHQGVAGLRAAVQGVGVGLRVGARQGEGVGAGGVRGVRGGRGRGGGGQEALGQDRDRRDAALLLLAELHADAVTVGEAGHDVQAEAQAVVALLVVGVLGVELGEAAVEAGQALARHRDALVLDGDHDLAALQQPAGDLDGQVGRGERGRVLHQLGQQVGEVVGREARDVHVGRERGDAHPLVPLDLADRRADDVDERDRSRVLLAMLGARQDKEVLAVPAHDRGEVVELEERGEALGVLLALLQALDDGELAFDEAESAQGEVDEGVADAVPQTVQLGGGLGEFGAQPFAGVGHLLPLADEVLAVGLQGGDALVEDDGVSVQGVDGVDDLGELVLATVELDGLLGRRVLGLGEPGGAEAQDGEGPGETAGHARGDTHGEQHQGAEDGDTDLQRGDVVVAQPLQGLGAAVVEGGLHTAHQVDTGGESRLGTLGVGGQIPVGERRLVGEGGQIAVGGVDLVAGDRGVVRGARGLRRGVVEVGEGGVGAQPGLLGGGAEGGALPGVGVRGGLPGARDAGERVDDGLGGGRHAEGGEQQPPGGCGLLYGGVQLGQSVGAGARAGRHLCGQALGEPVEFGDGGRVGGVRFQRAALAGERAPAQGRDAVEVVAQRGGRDGGVGAQFLHLPVDAGAALLAGRLGLGAAGGDVRGDLVALVGEGVGEGERVLGLLGERHQLLGVVQLPGGGDDGGDACAGDGGGHDGHSDDQPVPYVCRTPLAGGCDVAGGAGRGTGSGLRAPRGGRLLA